MTLHTFPILIPLALAAGLLAFPSAAAAQAGDDTAAIGVVGGVASGGNDTHGAVGGQVLFPLTGRVDVEVTGLYLDRGPATTAAVLGGNLVVNLTPRGGRFTPYLLGGAGVYHVEFDLEAPRYLGPISGVAPAGATYCPGTGARSGPGFGAPSWSGSGTCTGSGYWAVGDLPTFYARRLGTLTVPPGLRWDARDFTDPAISLGGGIDVHLAGPWHLRPDARVLLVLRGGRTHSIGLFTAAFAYRF